MRVRRWLGLFLLVAASSSLPAATAAEKAARGTDAAAKQQKKTKAATEADSDAAKSKKIAAKEGDGDAAKKKKKKAAKDGEGDATKKAEDALAAAIAAFRGAESKNQKVAAMRLRRAVDAARKAGSVPAALLAEADEALEDSAKAAEGLKAARAELGRATEAGDLTQLGEAIQLAKKAGLTKGPEVLAAEKRLGELEQERRKVEKKELRRQKTWRELARLSAAAAAAASSPANASARATALRAAIAAARDLSGAPGINATEDELLAAAEARLETAEWEALPRAEQLEQLSANFSLETCRPPREPLTTRMCQPLSQEQLAKRSRAVGENNCNHETLRPGAETPKIPGAMPQQTSKNFCKYPPPFDLIPLEDENGYQPSAFELPPELFNETELADEVVGETAVLNLDMSLFRSHIAPCGGRELWLIEFYVHWCPHCMAMMPKFYKLALGLRSAGAKLRVGAVNCATERELCGAFQVMGHPMIAFFYGGIGPNGAVQLFEYTGQDVRVNTALEHIKKNRPSSWDAGAPANYQPPKHLFPAEAFNHVVQLLPDDYRPTEAVLRWLGNSSAATSATACPDVRKWYSPSDQDASAVASSDSAAGASLNGESTGTAKVGRHPKAFPGNGWPVFEHAATPTYRVWDAAQALVHMLADWVVPHPGPGGVTSYGFSYAELTDLHMWAGLLAEAFPTPAEGGPAGLQPELVVLRDSLTERLRAIESADGRAALCAEEWRDFVARVRRAFDLARATNALPSLCRTDTCRVWSLLHVLSVAHLARSVAGGGTDGLTLDDANSTGTHNNEEALEAATRFLRRYFTCRSCRAHFVEQVEAEAHGLAAARAGRPQDLALWWWRLHGNVSARVAKEGKCRADRRWPAADICVSCWSSDASAGKKREPIEATVVDELVRQYWPRKPAPTGEASASGEEESADA